MCTAELLFLGPIPVGPFFPGAGCEAIDNEGTGETDGIPVFDMVVLSVSEVHQPPQLTG